MQNGFAYPSSTHQQHWTHNCLEEMWGWPRVYCRAVQTHLAPKFSLLWSRFLTFVWMLHMFKRTRRCLRGRSLACWLHRSISVSTIHAGVPGLLQLLHLLRNRALNSDLGSLWCSHVSATVRDTPCTAKQVRSLAKRPWAQGNVEQHSPAKFHTSSLAGMKYWQVTCSPCIALSAKNTSVTRKHAKGVMKSLPRGNKHLASRRESGRT